MIKNNKLKSYLLYSVGEILLVVIGIVMAVQVNNWNEERKLRNSAIVHLGLFHQDLQEDLRNLSILEQAISDQLESAALALDQFKTIRPLNDSLPGRLTILVIEHNFNAEKNGYSLLTNSDEIASFDDELQNMIAQYYALVDRVKEREEISNTFIKDKYEMHLMTTYAYLWGKNNHDASTNGFYRNDPRTVHPLDMNKLIKEKSLEVLVYARYFQLEKQHQQYKEAIKVLQALIERVKDTNE